MSNSWFNNFYTATETRREKIVNGIPTLIPFTSFPRLSKFIPGIIPNDQVLITANTGVGKSRFMRKLFIKDPIKFAIENNLKIKIFLNSLEESVDKVVSTFISSFLYEHYGIQLNFYQLNNYTTEPLPLDTMLKIKEAEQYINFLEQYLDIVHISNPYGFYKHIWDHLNKNGNFYKQGVVLTEYQTGWDKYIADDPNHIVIAITDTVNKYQEENGKGVYQTLRTFSEFYSRKLLGLQCNVINVIIQQQSPDNEKIEVNYRGKTLIEKLKPSLDALRDCRATQEDATLILGVFDPVKYGEYMYKSYPDLRNLKAKFRSLIVLKTREGELDDSNEIPLISYLGRDEFEELPLPTETDILKQFYK